MADTPLMRIGELARRTGMAEATLRAWERRYGIPRPKRTVGGHRLYSEQDVVRLSRIQRLVEQGWAVGAAARRVGRELVPGVAPVLTPAQPQEVSAEIAERLVAAFERFDATEAHKALDEGLSSSPVSSFLDRIVRPSVRPFTGSQDDLRRAQLRFGAALLHTRMSSLLADITSPAGEIVVACAAAGEFSDFSTLLQAIPLAEAGFTVRLLGADVPVALVAAAAAATDASVALVTAINRPTAEAFLREIDALSGVTVAVADMGFRDLDVPDGVLRAEAPGGNLVGLLRTRIAAMSS